MRRVTFVDVIPFVALIGFFLLGLYGSEQGGGGEFYLLIASVSGGVLVLGRLGLHFREQMDNLISDLQALRVRRARARLPEPETLEMVAAYSALQDRDYRTAVAILWLAAEQQDAQAQYVLSNLFSRGRGVPQCKDEALKWLARAARHGVVEAQSDLGNAYLEPGAIRNVMEGLKWLEIAAQQGNHTAQVRLGDVYAGGLEVRRDHDRAARWYRRAAEAGDPNARRALGRLYLHGKGVSKDPVQAFAWLRLAAEQGDRLAAKDLSRAGARLSALDRDHSEWLVSEWQGKLTEGADRAAKKKRKSEQKRINRERGRIVAGSVVDQIRAALAQVGAGPRETPPLEGLPPESPAADTATSAQRIDPAHAQAHTDRRAATEATEQSSPAPERSAAWRDNRRIAKPVEENALDDALAARAAEELDIARGRGERGRRRLSERRLLDRDTDKSGDKRRESARERVGRLSGGDINVPSRPRPAPEPIKTSNRRQPIPAGSRQDDVVISDAANRADSGQPIPGTGDEPISAAREKLESMAQRGSVLAQRLEREGEARGGKVGRRGRRRRTEAGEQPTSTSDEVGRFGGNRLSRRDRSALIAERLAALPQAKQREI